MLQRKPFFATILLALMAAGPSVAEDVPGVTATSSLGSPARARALEDSGHIVLRIGNPYLMG